MADSYFNTNTLKKDGEKCKKAIRKTKNTRL